MARIAAMQTPIPCLFMRGGTSKGPFFLETDLPADLPTRDRVLLSVMGSPDKRQIDGLGGAHPLTSKVGIVRPSTTPGVDLDFLFAQLQPDKDTVDTTPNCGNMLAAVVPFALERGLVQAQGDTSTFRVLTLNTDMQCDITVQTPLGPNGQRHVEYAGDARIDGAPGSSAPITINFLDTAGSVAPGLLPTGNVRDVIDGVAVTCIDNGMPVVLIRASDLGRTGYESRADLDADVALKARLEAIRLQAGPAMNLGDVSARTVPKMCLVAAPQQGGAISSRSFIPHKCHASIGVFGAVSVATACLYPGSVASDLSDVPAGDHKRLAVEHPTGEFTVAVHTDNGKVVSCGLVRTARLLFDGKVCIG